MPRMSESVGGRIIGLLQSSQRCTGPSCWSPRDDVRRFQRQPQQFHRTSQCFLRYCRSQLLPCIHKTRCEKDKQTWAWMRFFLAHVKPYFLPRVASFLPGSILAIGLNAKKDYKSSVFLPAADRISFRRVKKTNILNAFTFCSGISV